MREIKFRAWHKGRKEMCPVRGLIELAVMPAGDAMTGKAIILRDGLLREPAGFGKKDSPLIVMEYIGRKDKMDVEVWEGSILAQPHDQEAWESSEDVEGFSGERAVVAYDDKLTRFLLNFYTIYGGEGYSGKESGQQLCEYLDNGWIVIGNSHQNQELLHA